MPRRPLTYCLSALLGSSLVLGALPGGALAEDAVDAPIENPDLARPHVPSGAQSTAPDGWDGQNTQLFSAALAAHPARLQAASLSGGALGNGGGLGQLGNGPGTSGNGAAGTLSTRLWRVQKGSKVTVTWDDSPSPLTNCGTDDPTKGQQYRVSVTGEQGEDTQDFTTDTTTSGTAKWHEGRSYSFTAAENNPKISWAYRKASGCGPLVTHFRATQDPAPVPYDLKKARLPMPQAYQGRTPIEARLVAQDCLAGPRTCHFEKDDRYSYRYYDRPRMVGQAYVNCTRNPITDQRPVNWEELPYDNITQYFAQKDGETQKPQQPGPQGLQQQAAPQQPHQTDVRQGFQNIATQIAAGFTRADGNPLEMATNNPLLYGRKEQRNLSVTVQPGEVSWIEVQASRERLAGALIHDSKNERMDVFADVPSGSLGDRFYQRTGPMSKVELARCADARDNARTPDNTIGAPTLRAAAHLVPAGAAPRGIRTRSVPLTAAAAPARD
ncbi:hypothetical protein JK361_09345 [Streptomyces sp. 5-8]|uniref:Secreted protein n=1 Tax=Streptomyces musisoli TaxID=2802280 RepID=A0ABS1NXH3_9ACTN|nr:hypothetical protein [Streptomyces musisoli]MBL1104796.1 hypothetical protein [Streptomyces musisoli]